MTKATGQAVRQWDARGADPNNEFISRLSNPSKATLIVTVLKRQADTSSPQKSLAFSIIAQAITDLGNFSSTPNPADLDLMGALDFLEVRSEGLAESIGLDHDWMLQIVNHRIGNARRGLLDEVRIAIEHGLLRPSRPRRERKARVYG